MSEQKESQKENKIENDPLRELLLQIYQMSSPKPINLDDKESMEEFSSWYNEYVSTNLNFINKSSTPSSSSVSTTSTQNSTQDRRSYSSLKTRFLSPTKNVVPSFEISGSSLEEVNSNTPKPSLLPKRMPSPPPSPRRISSPPVSTSKSHSVISTSSAPVTKPLPSSSSPNWLSGRYSTNIVTPTLVSPHREKIGRSLEDIKATTKTEVTSEKKIHKTIYQKISRPSLSNLSKIKNEPPTTRSTPSSPVGSPASSPRSTSPATTPPLSPNSSPRKLFFGEKSSSTVNPVSSFKDFMERKLSNNNSKKIIIKFTQVDSQTLLSHINRLLNETKAPESLKNSNDSQNESLLFSRSKNTVPINENGGEPQSLNSSLTNISPEVGSHKYSELLDLFYEEVCLLNPDLSINFLTVYKKAKTFSSFLIALTNLCQQIHQKDVDHSKIVRSKIKLTGTQFCTYGYAIIKIFEIKFIDFKNDQRALWSRLITYMTYQLDENKPDQ